MICANRPAKACGVRKHMRPGEARPLVEPRGGALVHAFCRDWPGPRVNYSRYNAASREFFAAFEDALRGRSPVVERASIDEGYAEVEPTGAAAARALCVAVKAAVERATKLTVSVGCGPNKLLAKLASAAAKGTADAVEVLDGGAAVAAFLAATPAARLPGVVAAEGSCADHFKVAKDEKTRAKCRGVDAAAVAAKPPASASVTSWTTHARMSDLCRTDGGDGFSFPRLKGGSWVFATHPKTDAPLKTNDTRRFWILFSLALDLEERLRHDAALHGGRRPTKLSLSVQGCGTDPEPLPGSNYVAGGVSSRAVAFPPLAPAPSAAAEADLAARVKAGCERGTDDDVPPGLYRRVHAIVDAAASALQSWSKDEDRRVAKLTLTATHFVAAPAATPVTALFKKTRPSEASPRPAEASPRREASARKRPSEAPDEARLRPADVDPETLAELPRDLREEIERQMAAERGAPPRKKPALEDRSAAPPPESPRSAARRRVAAALDRARAAGIDARKLARYDADWIERKLDGTSDSAALARDVEDFLARAVDDEARAASRNTG